MTMMNLRIYKGFDREIARGVTLHPQKLFTVKSLINFKFALIIKLTYLRLRLKRWPMGLLQNCHFEASGFSFRTNLCFKGLQLNESFADFQDSCVKINLKSQKTGYLTKCSFSVSLFFSI